MKAASVLESIENTAEAPRRRAVTLKDVAARAGVGPMSASVVLNGTQASTRVSEATRKHIIEVAQELGYRRNGGAAAARSGRFGNIALVMSTNPSRSFLSTGLIIGIHEELDLRDVHMTMVRLSDNQLSDNNFVPKILRELGSDGLIVDYNLQIPPRLVELIEKYQIPVVWVNIQQPTDSVYPDDEGAARDATEHLLQLGHRNILYLSHAASGHDSVANRQCGYEQAMLSAGLIPHVEKMNDETPEVLWERMQQWLGGKQAPTAVLAYEAYFALPVWLAAEKMGRRVPEDMSLMAIHEDVLKVLGRELTTWEIPVFDMGRESVRMLLQKIERPDRPLASQKLPFHRRLGQTCAPCKRQD